MKKLLRSTAMVLALGGFALPVHAQNANTNETNQLANASSGSQGFCDRSWDQIDANSDGMVDKTEVTGAADARFKQIDTDGNGELSSDEFSQCVMRQSGQASAESDRDAKSYSSLDLNGDNQVNVEEFRDSAQQSYDASQRQGAGDQDFVVLRRFIWLTPEEAKNGVDRNSMSADEAAGRAALNFSALDENGDGSLDSKEWSNRSPRLERSKEWVNAKFAEIDADSSGSITRSEYNNAEARLIDKMSTASTSSKTQGQAAEGKSGEQDSAASNAASDEGSGSVPVFIYHFWSM